MIRFILLVFIFISASLAQPDFENLSKTSEEKAHATPSGSKEQVIGENSSERALGLPGGPAIQDATDWMKRLRSDGYDAELLISFGTSKKGSAGHLAISIHEQSKEKETVYSANFYADLAPEHQEGHYTEKLMAIIPKEEYLYGSKSTVSNEAVFGLDYGEVFQRAVLGVRIYNLGETRKKGIVRFIHQLNEDFKNRKQKTDYHNGPIVYNYMNMNCAKTVALAVKHGGNVKRVSIKGEHILGNVWGVRALAAHTPTATAMDIIKRLEALGCTFDTVLYKKWPHSTAIHSDFDLAFKDLPNRFPSMLSLDYLNGNEKYEDYDNLYAMHFFHNLGKYSLTVSRDGRLFADAQKTPMSYDGARKQARKSAWSKSKSTVRRLFRSMGVKITSGNDNSDLYGN